MVHFDKVCVGQAIFMKQFVIV